MAATHIEQLRSLQERLTAASRQLGPSESRELAALEEAATNVGRAWSGSQLGYHANIYHAGLKPPPPGAHFSSEWGLMKSFAPGTSGDWREYGPDEVKGAIRNAAGDPRLDALSRAFPAVTEHFRTGKRRFESLVTSASPPGSDSYLDGLRSEADALQILSLADCIRLQIGAPSPLTTRDAVAASAGFRPAPHQEILAEVVAKQSPFIACQELAALCGTAADHLELRSPRSPQGELGYKIFIGHGRSSEWMKLKEFIQTRLGLEWDEFNRVPVAGVTNVARLESMLDQAAIALLVMTAEDAQSDGTFRARENVVHEAGLFQGRLGFMRAVVLVEDSCETFSNIEGLGQIRFPTGRIEAAFEELRRFLEREEVIPPPDGATPHSAR